MLRALVVVMLLPGHAVAAAPPRDGWVVLPVDEYRALRDKAHPALPETDRPPVEATLTRLDYDLRVEGDAAVGRARLSVDVMKDGWVRVPIPSGLYVSSARVDGHPVALVDSQDGTQPTEVLLSRPGRAAISLEIAVPIAAGAGTQSISLPPGGSAVTCATVVVPRDGVDVALSGGLFAEKDDGGKQSRWVAYGDGRSPLAFSWRRKVEDHRATLPLRLRGTLVQHAGFGEENVHLVADIRVDVVQGVATKVALQVPEGVSIVRVSGRNVADWEAIGTTLTVTFLDPVDSSEAFVLSLTGRSQ